MIDRREVYGLACKRNNKVVLNCNIFKEGLAYTLVYKQESYEEVTTYKDLNKAKERARILRDRYVSKHPIRSS